MNPRLKKQISLLPHRPGVYLMHNRDGKIIYIGKAKDLQKRVSQYFLRPQLGKVALMASLVDYFETIITASEKDALILEMNLIKEHLPRFNVMLKDDGHYPYIAIRKTGDPYLKITRSTKGNNYRYFGPYPNSRSAYQIIDLLNKIFPLRKCKNLPKVPCLYYHLGQCLAPCINTIDEETYTNLVSQIERFLNGHDREIKSEIRKKMLSASKALNYELALEYKNILAAIDNVQAKQVVEQKDKTNRDIFAYTARDGYIGLSLLVYRDGRLLGKNFYVVEQFHDLQEQVTHLISQYYSTHPLPTEIIILDPQIGDELAALFEVKVYHPTRGRLFDLGEMAQQNAIHGLDEHFLTARLDDNKDLLLQQLGDQLQIATPYHIDLFDNAHLQGAHGVAALVVYINAEPVKKMYRKFHLSDEEAGDDTKSMHAVITRRYKRLLSDHAPLPDLVLVDGGLGQVHAAQAALQGLGLDLPVAGLFKNDKHQTSGLINGNGDVVALETKSPLFFLLMRMQDEVHRFAITFHRHVRSKSLFTSLLDGVTGLGKVRQMLVIKTYPNLADLKKATIEELSQLLPPLVATALYHKIHDSTDN